MWSFCTFFQQECMPGPLSWLDAEEDELLRTLAAKHANVDGKISWVAVAAEMPGRTDNHVWRRWAVLSKGARPAKPKKR